MSWIDSPFKSLPTLSKDDFTELVSSPRTRAANVTSIAMTSWTNSITSRLKCRSDNKRPCHPSQRGTAEQD